MGAPLLCLFVIAAAYLSTDSFSASLQLRLAICHSCGHIRLCAFSVAVRHSSQQLDVARRDSGPTPNGYIHQTAPDLSGRIWLDPVRRQASGGSRASGLCVGGGGGGWSWPRSESRERAEVGGRVLGARQRCPPVAADTTNRNEAGPCWPLTGAPGCVLNPVCGVAIFGLYVRTSIIAVPPKSVKVLCFFLF